ncbi:MAG: hypothetical protein PHI40_05710 [Caldisericia bacterium]|nr:hypothetical protein [Caldisericia bacterium]
MDNYSLQKYLQPNKTTLEAVDDTIHNRNMSKSFDSIDALIDDLHAGT